MSRIERHEITVGGVTVRTYERECRHCGKLFVTTGQTVWICSDECRTERRRGQLREAQRRYWQRAERKRQEAS